MWKWVKRLVVSLVVLTIAATLFVVIAARTAWGRNLVRSEVEASLAKTFPGGAKIGRIDGNLLGAFTVHDIELRDLDGRVAIKIGKLEAEVELQPLLRKRAVIETAIAEDVLIAIGKAKLVAPPDPADTEPSKWTVELPAVEVRNGTLEIDKGYPVALDQIALTGELAIPAGEPLAAKLKASGTWRERAQRLELSGTVEVGTAVTIETTGTLGGATFSATKLVIDPVQPSGRVELAATVAQVATFVPGVELPADASLVIDADVAPLGELGSQLSVTGNLGDAKLTGAIRADLVALSARGFIGVGATDLGKLTKNRVRGRGESAFAISADRDGARGIVSVRGKLDDYPVGSATLFIDATFKPNKDRVLATKDGPIQATGTATITALATTEGNVRSATTAVGAWSRTATMTHAWLDQGRTVAVATDLAPVTKSKVTATGRELRADVELTKQSTLYPVVDVQVKGTARGSGVRYDRAAVATAFASFNGKAVGRRITAWGTGNARGIANAGTAVGDADVEGRLLEDGRIWSKVTARPVAADLVAVAEGHVTLGDKTIDIAIGDHKITPKVGAVWAGKGGAVKITEQTIVVDNFTTGNSDGSARVDAKLGRTNGNIDTAITATRLPASAVHPTYRGTASGKVTLKRRGRRWDGDGVYVTEQLYFVPDVPILDGNGTFTLRGRDLKLDAKTSNPRVGEVRLTIDVEGPRDVTDPIAWRRLERTAIRVATITIDKVDLGTVVSSGGIIDGKLDLAGNETTGKLKITKVETPVGTAEGELVVTSFLGKHINASGNARVTDLGEGNLVVQVKLPDHPFDPVAWKQLGRNALLAFSTTFDNIAVDAKKLAKLGVEAPYEGKASVNVRIGPGATVGNVAVIGKTIVGGVLIAPIDVHVFARTDDKGTTGHACVVRVGVVCPEDTDGIASATAGPKLIHIENVTVPVTFEKWLSAPKSALAAPLAGTLTIPKQSAPALLAMFGRDEFLPTKGTAEGKIVVGGTLGKPTAVGDITMKNLAVYSEIGGRDIPELVELVLSGTWDGRIADIKVTANERHGGTLLATTTIEPTNLGDARAKLEAKDFELAPLAAFLPGELAASSGRLKGDATVEGFDFATSKIRGELLLTKGYIPITPIVGTLRDGTATLKAKDAGITLDAQGLLNTCRDPAKPNCVENVTLTAKAPHDLATLTATLDVKKISPLAEIEPLLDGLVEMDLARNGRDWTGVITVRDGYVFVPPSVGDDLLAAGLPDDVYFVDQKPAPESAFRTARRVTKSWLRAKVNILSTRIEVEEYGVVASVKSRDLELIVGDTIGLEGKIVVEYGVADDVFGRQYRIRENEIVRFDGTIDPEIALYMTHQFPDLLLTMSVTGRLSDKKFPNPHFESDQGNRYDESELFGFFLGGAPGGTSDSTTAAKEASISAGTSVLSQAIAKRVKNFMPKRLKLDVIKCEPGTSGGGASCTLGKRFLDGKLYIAYKRRLAALPNENADEGQAQYYLSKEVYLEGVGGSSNIIGADLLWRRRW